MSFFCCSFTAFTFFSWLLLLTSLSLNCPMTLLGKIALWPSALLNMGWMLEWMLWITTHSPELWKEALPNPLIRPQTQLSSWLLFTIWLWRFALLQSCWWRPSRLLGGCRWEALVLLLRSEWGHMLGGRRRWRDLVQGRAALSLRRGEPADPCQHPR